MDGQIGKAINKRALGSEMPDSAVPTKAAKLELPSKKKVEIRAEPISKQTLSSPPIASPDKERAISSTDSSLSGVSHSFDFRFVASDDEVRQLLVAETGDENRDVTLISHPDDLSQANLVSRLSISGDGRHTLRSGKLFEGSKPFTLVIDIRKLTSEELPKFNDLLDPDNPCLYDKVSQKKRPLGDHVALLVLANPAQLASVSQCDDAAGATAPGADFWRRINRPGNTWQFNAQANNDPSMAIDTAPPLKAPPLLAELPCAESAMDDDNTVLIDCHLHNNWRQFLLGGPGVDKQGRIRHLPGRLESLMAGQRVILKGANWEDLAFEQTIRQMLAQKCFESNGKICPLPDDVQFYQMSVGNDELRSLFQSLSQPADKGLDKPHTPRNPIIINQSNISEWLNPIAIAPGGYAVPNICLLEQVRAGAAVTVTSPLSEALWFCLLGSLQTIRETTGLEPRLQVADSGRQPKALGLAENDEHPIRDRVVFNTVTYQQPAQASHWINDQPQAPLVIQVNEQTGFSQLFDNIHISSEQKAHFGRRQSKLQEALTAGKPVVFLGLERNPTLQQLLEPLVLGQPLLVNGQLQTYPEAHVTLLWPEFARSRSSIFNSMVAMGKPCPEVDLWAINALKHGIPRIELPEQALDELYEAFKTVPLDLCNPLPEMTEGLLNNLILAARRAQQVDQSPQLLPRHWRKAIHSTITHGTRQNPSVRDFMQVACWRLLPDAHENQTAWVDPDQLNDIINSAPRLDRASVEQHLWPLFKAFDPGAFKPLELSYVSPLPWEDRKEILDRLCTLIVANAPEQQRQAMAYQLAVDPESTELCQSLAIRPSRQIKRLQDALASGWQLPLSPGQARSDAIQSLATDCFYIARTANSDAAGIEHIENRLSESLEWTGSTDKPLSALARDLYHGEMGQKDRESRRLSRLHDRLADSPVIFLQGETGTGKSYFSAKLAKASGPASIISLGPSDSEQTLMKRWQWQERADGDRSMAQENRLLMEWAKTPDDKDGEYVTLILDEANLAKAGLLTSLNGLWEPEPCIYVNGHPVKVSKKHRVILTGNPDHYAGRQMDPALKEKLPRAYYPKLDRAFLRDRVVEPALVRQLQRHLPEQQIDDIAHIATESVMTLWRYYQELLPGHEFTPRDLTDICSWVGWYLDRALPINDSVTDRQMHGLIQQSFRDVLGAEISDTHQDALSALEIWFAARYEPDNTLSDKVHTRTLQDIQQAFKTFTQKTRPDFDTSGSAVSELVQRLGQDLSRCQQAYHLNRKHGGRQATLIEGPAGRGKDATLNLVVETVKRQAEERGESTPEVFPLNACDCSWDRVCEKIQTAKVHGGIVVISEMNLIDSQHLEGELNDILAGDAHPGFHLFATINPPEYSGRKPLSPALKGRFRHLPIRQYNPAELQTIAEKVLPQTPEGKIVAKKLTEAHCRLRAYLQQKNLPLQPTSLDLQNVARAVIRAGDFTENGLRRCLNRHYRLYLMATNLSLEELPEPRALAVGNGALDPEMSQWFYQTVSGINRPWFIRHSDRDSIDEKHHEICIKTRLNKEEAKTEIITKLAQAWWQKSGLPLKLDESDDILIRALYRHWQQIWFNRQFGQTGVGANSVFPMTDEEEQTLKLPTSQPYLREADQRISIWNSNAVQCWPGFWHQISGLPNHWVGNDINKVPTVDGDNAPEPYDPEVLEKEAPALDRRTNFEARKVSESGDHIVFDTYEDISHMYRYSVLDIYVTAGGNIKSINLKDLHIKGVETLMPDRLPGRDQTLTLASDQTLGTMDVTSDNGQYALPSMKANDYIVALRTEPDFRFTLVRDNYTGLHTLSIPEAKANQTIKVTYVVEPREPGKETRVKQTRPATDLDTYCSKGMKKVLNKVFTTIDQQRSAKVRELLQTIKDAKDTDQRIKAIKAYCEQFSGKAKPKRHANFFEFLVTRQQGSCRHRVPVFIAFCRYFGIPCRQIESFSHIFAEYSGDGGQTWESVDLDGAPVVTVKTTSDFQPNIKIKDSRAKSKKIKALLKDFLKGADLTQQQILAKACGMNLEKLNKALETNSALPEINLNISKIVKNLWEENNLTSFSVGVSLLVSLETKELTEDEMLLLSITTDKGGNVSEPMSEAVRKIVSNNDEDQIIEQLKLLHSKMILQAGTSTALWLNSMVDILKGSDLTKPSVIHFASEALKLDWLDPPSTDDLDRVKIDEHHRLLVSLEAVDELKVKAAHCLKKWYKAYLPKERDGHIWLLSCAHFQEKEGSTMFVTHGHDGFSPFLKSAIACLSLQTSWSDEPEGIPNIERMLVQQPAFRKLNSGRASHRPVIILGQPSWDNTAINEQADAMLQRKVENSPDLKLLLEKIKLKSSEVSSEDQRRLDDLRDKYQQAIQQAFSYYLYEVTHSKGSSLTYCWAEASMWKSKMKNFYGSHEPSSPEKLFDMMSHINSSLSFQNSINDAYLREVHNASNALVLKSRELTKIAEEFLSSVNLKSIYDALDA